MRKSEFLRERLGPLLALFALCLLFGVASPRFFAIDNFLNVARQISLNGIVAVGMTLVVVSGGIDLSVGSVLALSICVAGVLMEGGTSAVPALGAGLATGIACGALNGIVVVRLRITPFIASLGMMSFARGAAMVITSGNPIAKLDRSYFFLGTGSLVGIPAPVWVMLLVALFGGFLLSRTRLGRYALALGSNEEAVRLAGIPVGRVKLVLYMLMGGLSAVAGWILSARVASADPSAGVLMELEAIAAVVIGGASLKGGRGSVTGTLIGAAIMGVLNNGLVLLGIGAFWQQLLVGVVIVAAVAIDQLRSTGRPHPHPLMRRVVPVVGAIAALAALGLAVFRPAPTTTGGQGTENGRLVIAVIGKASGGEYWLAVKAGAERKGAELGVDVLWQGTPQETDVSKQIDLVENLIQRRVSGIAVAPTDANALSPIIKRALDAQIPVLTIDSDSSAKDRLSYIGTDNRAAGEEAGREMKRLLGGHGKVAIITGVLGAQNLRQRCAGFKAGVAGSAIEVLTEQTDAGDRAKALALAESLLLAHPDLAGFFTDTANSGPAVAQALIARKLIGKVKVVAFDVTPELSGYLEQGAVEALVAQRPERIGELAVEMQVARSHGDAIPPLVDTGVSIVRKGGAATPQAATATTADAAASAAEGGGDTDTAALFERVTRHTRWAKSESVPLDFDAHRPQGLARVGSDFWLASVEITNPPKDAFAGKGVAHLRRIDKSGRKTADLSLGEGDVYWAGGIDYDGDTLWAVVTNPGANGHSIVYAIDPVNMTVKERFRSDERLVFVVRDKKTPGFVAATWWSASFVVFDDAGRKIRSRTNPSEFVDLGDCGVVGGARMLCGGVADLAGPRDAGIELGGLALVDMSSLDVVHEAPIDEYTAMHRALTRGAVHVDAPGNALHLYTVAGEGKTSLETWVAARP